MDIDEFRELWYKIKAEDIEKQIRDELYVPPADHIHHHRWTASRIDFRKKLFRRILWGVIAAIFTIGAGVYVTHYQENRFDNHGQLPPHVHIDEPEGD